MGRPSQVKNIADRQFLKIYVNFGKQKRMYTFENEELAIKYYKKWIKEYPHLKIRLEH